MKLVVDFMSGGRLEAHIMVASRSDRYVERAMRELNPLVVYISSRQG